jgi:transposase InsO family protein
VRNEWRIEPWAYQRGVLVDFSRPGKPTDNAFIEAFNGRFRAECLNAHFMVSEIAWLGHRLCVGLDNHKA